MIGRPLNSALRSYARSKWDRMKPWRDFNPCFVETTLLCLECICLCTGEWKCNPVPSFEIYKYSASHIYKEVHSICFLFLLFVLFFSEIFNQFWNLPTLSLVQLSEGGKCHLCATAWNPVRKFAADLKWNPDLFCDYSLSLPLRSVRLHKPVATQMNVTPAHGFSQWSPPLAPEPSLHFALLPSDYDLKRSADMTHSHNALWLNPEP